MTQPLWPPSSTQSPLPQQSPQLNLLRRHRIKPPQPWAFPTRGSDKVQHHIQAHLPLFSKPPTSSRTLSTWRTKEEDSSCCQASQQHLLTTAIRQQTKAANMPTSQINKQATSLCNRLRHRLHPIRITHKLSRKSPQFLRCKLFRLLPQLIRRRISPQPNSSEINEGRASLNVRSQCHQIICSVLPRAALLHSSWSHLTSLSESTSIHWSMVINDWSSGKRRPPPPIQLWIYRNSIYINDSQFVKLSFLPSSLSCCITPPAAAFNVLSLKRRRKRELLWLRRRRSSRVVYYSTRNALRGVSSWRRRLVIPS